MACSAIAWSFVETVGDLEVSLIFPSSRTLCPASPSLQWVAWASLPLLLRYYPQDYLFVLRYDCHLPVSVSYALARSPIPGLQPLVFVSLLTCRLVRGRLPLPNARAVWSSGSPLSSGLSTRKQMALPSSQSTPVSACPALRPRWCPQSSP